MNPARLIQNSKNSASFFSQNNNVNNKEEESFSTMVAAWSWQPYHTSSGATLAIPSCNCQVGNPTQTLEHRRNGGDEKRTQNPSFAATTLTFQHHHKTRTCPSRGLRFFSALTQPQIILCITTIQLPTPKDNRACTSIPYPNHRHQHDFPSRLRIGRVTLEHGRGQW